MSGRLFSVLFLFLGVCLVVIAVSKNINLGCPNYDQSKDISINNIIAFGEIHRKDIKKKYRVVYEDLFENKTNLKYFTYYSGVLEDRLFYKEHVIFYLNNKPIHVIEPLTPQILVSIHTNEKAIIPNTNNCFVIKNIEEV